MDMNEFSILIEKYKKGECTSRERDLLDNYLESFQNNPDEWNENEMGNRGKTEKKILSEIKKHTSKGKNNLFIRTFLSPALLKRAASIIFLLVLASGALYISGIFEAKQLHVVWNQKVTSPGVKTLITLPDGSKVMLNAGSKLKYPDKFDNAIREVFLEGEAYFEVRHDANKPFIVQSGTLSTTVLGTVFNISAFPVDRNITVSLLEGKVKVSGIEKGMADKTAILKPKEQLIYNLEKHESVLEKFDSLEVVGWKDNIYKFENVPLDKVLTELERAFDVKFLFGKQSILKRNITIKFENNSINTVAEVIKNLTGMDYKIIKRKDGKNDISFF